MFKTLIYVFASYDTFSHQESLTHCCVCRELTNRRAIQEVRQTKRRSPVTAVCSAENGIQGLHNGDENASSSVSVEDLRCSKYVQESYVAFSRRNSTFGARDDILSFAVPEHAERRPFRELVFLVHFPIEYICVTYFAYARALTYCYSVKKYLTHTFSTQCCFDIAGKSLRKCD